VTRPTGRTRLTGRMTRLDPAREAVRLIVDYEDADDFLADYDQNISAGTAMIETDRDLRDGAFIQLRIEFPGLLVPVVIDGVARNVEGSCARIHVRPAATLTTLVDRVRQRDRLVVMPVFKVLIVEDNPHVVQLVANGLAASARRELGHVMFSFSTAPDGAVALELVKQTKFDVVIVDVYLPVLDGPGFIRQVRTSLGLTDLPIITMSGGGPSARDAALRAGASTFLDKPVRLRQVVETMRQLIKV
jgi:CheY-like chemotaxis protein